MSNINLLFLDGDGIGPEVMAEAKAVLEWIDQRGYARFNIQHDLVGGASFDACGRPLSATALANARAADAVFLGAVGGPKWDEVAYENRPEAGLLQLRQELKLFANLRPAICYQPLATASSLKAELVEGLDILIVRELTGGVYFGEPKEIVTLANGDQRAVDTQLYHSYEIERIARLAFELARSRGGKLYSAEKRNVMQTGLLWNQVVSALHASDYSDVSLTHILADNCAMQLVRNPKQFDVIVTDNLFGDILSDEAAMLTGSLGMLPSASIGAVDAVTGKRRALYEPVHGSAPDIAGTDGANPLAAIGSVAMALRYSFDLAPAADLIEAAIVGVLNQNIRTADIFQPGMRRVGTRQMGQAVIEEMARLAERKAG